MDWFTVDKEGLAQLLERKGKGRLVFELVQNSWDEPGVTHVSVSLGPAPQRGRSLLVVTDDAPDGFADLTHAFTLFAPSQKKSDTSRRGRFNMGEKLVLALCDEAEVLSTTGGYRFTPEGRSRLRQRRDAGSQFAATVRLTGAEREEVLHWLRLLLPPAGVTTTVNGEVLPGRREERRFSATLRTEVADPDGVLRPTRRSTEISLHAPEGGESAFLYELGIPVVEIDLPWHVNVLQKVPLDFERSNVTPAYLRDVRVAVLNALGTDLPPEAATQEWARAAAAAEQADADAARHVFTCRFGAAVAYDPSDVQANAEAVLKGYTVVSGGALTREEWRAAKRVGALPPAGQVTPSNSHVRTSPDGTPPLEQSRLTPGMRSVVQYAAALGQELLGHPVRVEVHRSLQGFAAAYGDGVLMFNLQRLGHRFFDAPDPLAIDALLLHEFAHERVSDHLSEAFHDEICRLGALLRGASTRFAPADH